MLPHPRNHAVFRIITKLMGLAVALAFGGQGAFALPPRLVSDINPQPATPDIWYPNYFFDFNGVALFVAADGLWRSDGTPAGTTRLKAMSVPNTTVSTAYAYSPWWAVIDGQLFFVGDDGVHGRELWKTDGTAEGTVMVRLSSARRSASTPTPPRPTTSSSTPAKAKRSQPPWTASSEPQRPSSRP